MFLVNVIKLFVMFLSILGRVLSSCKNNIIEKVTWYKSIAIHPDPSPRHYIGDDDDYPQAY